MRIFLTGATGFIGTHVIPELKAGGHQVVGLTRSESGAETLRGMGVEPYLGTLEEPEALAKGAESADAVIHCAFDHDMSNFVANCQKDARVITALGAVLKGSDRPLLITSGTGIGSPGHGQIAVESVANFEHPNPRILSEQTGQAMADQGVNVQVMRLPQVHDTEKQGLVTYMIQICKAKGRVAYVGEGQNRWAAGAVADVALLYKLAIEQGRPGERFHAVGEEGVTARAMAEALGRGLKLPVVSVSPEEAAAEFGFFAAFAALDMPASSAWTRERLGWTPTGASLIADLDAMDYSVFA